MKRHATTLEQMLHSPARLLAVRAWRSELARRRNNRVAAERHLMRIPRR